MRCLHRRKGRVIHSLMRATITAEYWRKQYNHILYPQKYFFIEWEKKSHEDWLSHVCLLLVQADTPAAPCQHTWCKLSEFHKVPISSSFYSSDTLFYEPHRWSACHFRRSKSLLFTASMWHVFSPDGCSVWHNVEAWARNSSSVSYLLHGLGQVTSILCVSGSPYVKWC